jgi:Alkylmercury lyase
MATSHGLTRAKAATAEAILGGREPMTERHQGTGKSTLERLARAALSPEENAVRKAILTAFAEQGSAPSVHEVAHSLALPVEDVLEGFRKLAAYDLIVWREDETRILSAYPFSGVPTAHQVLIDGHNRLYAMCAIDALGVPFMLGQGARIRSTCFFCQQPVTVEVHGGSLQEASPLTTV